MFARLEIPVGVQRKLMIPEAALIRSGQLRFVYVEGPAGPERRSVRVGNPIGTEIEVISGIKAGVTLIVPAV
jgi:hypothetical protein